MDNQAKYKTNKSNMMKRTRAKITFMFSAVGTYDPLFVTVAGLNNRHLYRRIIF